MKKYLILLLLAMSICSSHAQSYTTRVKIYKMYNQVNEGGNVGSAQINYVMDTDLTLRIALGPGPTLVVQTSSFPGTQLGLSMFYNHENNAFFRNASEVEKNGAFDMYYIVGDYSIAFYNYANDGTNLGMRINSDTSKEYIIELTQKQYWDIKIFIVENCRSCMRFYQ